MSSASRRLGLSCACNGSSSLFPYRSCTQSKANIKNIPVRKEDSYGLTELRKRFMLYITPKSFSISGSRELQKSARKSIFTLLRACSFISAWNRLKIRFLNIRLPYRYFPVSSTGVEAGMAGASSSYWKESPGAEEL